MLGVIVNAAAILVGGVIGLLIKKGIPERFSSAIMSGIGLCILYIGISGALAGENIIVLVVSIVLGVTAGTALKIDKRLNRLGELVEEKFANTKASKTPNEPDGTNGTNGTNETEKSETKTPIAQGFVTGSLLFCVGAMAIIGSINSGLLGDHTILFAKSTIDMITTVILTVTLGVGVLLSAASVFIYQGAIVLLAQLLRPLLENQAMIAELNCAGSVLIIAIGLNMLGVTKIKVADFLPTIIFVPIVFTIVSNL